LKIFDNIKKLIGKRELNKLVAHRKHIECKGFQNSKYIGIVYDATHENAYKSIKALMENIKKYDKTVKSLGYANLPELANFHIQPKEFEFFCNKDLNWFKKPTDEGVERFCNTEFDILLDLSINDHLPLQFVVAMSDAKFKTGRYSKTNIQLYDMLIDISENPSLEFLTDQSINYLKMINPKF
jgi:hypothetical protein